MPVGQSDLGNPSLETPFLGDARMCQTDTLGQVGQKGRQNHSDGLDLSSIGLTTVDSLVPGAINGTRVWFLN